MAFAMNLRKPLHVEAGTAVAANVEEPRTDVQSRGRAAATIRWHPCR